MSTKTLAICAGVWWTVGLAAAGLLASCNHPARPAPSLPADASAQLTERPPAATDADHPGTLPDSAEVGVDLGPLEFIPDRFDQLYPIFLVRHSMSRGAKAGLWHQRYFGKWVRWTGRVRSFTANGITISELPTTVTFDVSLWVEAEQLPSLHSRLRIGGPVTYIGKLDGYDDVFRTLYLTHGAIIDPPDLHPDGGS